VVGADLMVPVWWDPLVELSGIVLMDGLTIIIVALIRADNILLVWSVMLLVDYFAVGVLLAGHVCQELLSVLLLFLTHVIRAIGILERAVQIVAIFPRVIHVPPRVHAIGAIPRVSASHINPQPFIVRILDI